VHPPIQIRRHHLGRSAAQAAHMDGLGVAMEEAATCPVLAPRERLCTTGHETTRYCYRNCEKMLCYIEAPPLS